MERQFNGTLAKEKVELTISYDNMVEIVLSSSPHYRIYKSLEDRKLGWFHGNWHWDDMAIRYKYTPEELKELYQEIQNSWKNV